MRRKRIKTNGTFSKAYKHPFSRNRLETSSNISLPVSVKSKEQLDLTRLVGGLECDIRGAVTTHNVSLYALPASL